MLIKSAERFSKKTIRQDREHLLRHETEGEKRKAMALLNNIMDLDETRPAY